jgi:hypothetical protein
VPRAIICLFASPFEKPEITMQDFIWAASPPTRQRRAAAGRAAVAPSAQVPEAEVEGPRGVGNGPGPEGLDPAVAGEQCGPVAQHPARRQPRRHPAPRALAYGPRLGVVRQGPLHPFHLRASACVSVCARVLFLVCVRKRVRACVRVFDQVGQVRLDRDVVLVGAQLALPELEKR